MGAEVGFESLSTIADLLSLGALGIVNLLLFAFFLGGSRDYTFLVFAAFNWIVALHTLAFRHLDALVGLDLGTALWSGPLDRLLLYSFPVIYLGFLRAILRDGVSRPLILGAGALVASMAALEAGAPSGFILEPAFLFPPLALPVGLLGTGLIVWSMRRHGMGAVWLLGGNLVFVGAAANDLLVQQGFIRGIGLMPLGFAVFASAYCAALVLRLVVSELAASQRLALLNRALEDEVVERTAKAMDATAAAEKAALAKQEFLAVMSHEIRTPLHGWAGLTELLERTSLDERQRGYVQMLKRTAAHLTRLIGDVLDMSRLDSGRLELEPAPFRLSELIDELAAVGRGRAADRGLNFDLDVAEGLPEALMGDSRVIKQVVYNFLDNAAKYTDAGRVRLEVFAVEDGAIRFAVTDSGCGIRPDLLDKVFDVFTQIDPLAPKHQASFGLGLSLCRRLVEMMGGQVGVLAQPGKGSTFWCDLPLSAAEPPPVLVPVPSGRLFPAGTRILLVDDAELNRLVVRDFLNGTGCVVHEAADGAAAVTMVGANEPYDLIVMDLRMPGMNGFEAARAIRAREKRLELAAVPIAALSAGAAASDRSDALEAGCNVFLAKPIGREALISALAALLPEGAAKAEEPDATDEDEDEVPHLAAGGLPDIPEGLEHLLPAFIAEMDRDCATLLALKDGDSQLLAEHVHGMRGKCAMFGETVLFDLLSGMEALHCVAGPDLEALAALVEDRVAELNELGKNLA